MLLWICIISGLFYVRNFLVSVFSEEFRQFPVGYGVVFIISVWNFSLGLAITVIVFTVIGMIINFIHGLF